MKICVQAGHAWTFPPFLTGGGGAPGEAMWATELAARIDGYLKQAGVEVVCVGAWLVNGVVKPAPALVTDEDYALCLSLHFDANLGPTYNTGGFADRYRPELLPTSDPRSRYPNQNAAAEDRFIAIWERRYLEALSIPRHNERRNPNSYDYYGYRATTDATPMVILEHGVGQGLDHAALFDRIDEVARVDAACVLEYLGITHPEEEDDMAKVQELQAQIDQLNGITKTMQAQIDYKDELLQAANSRAGVAEAEVERLTKEITNADLRTGSDIGSVAVTRRDGRVELVN